MLLNEKKISIVIATFNGEKYLREQLYSIMNQTYSPTEIVICDDNSNDLTMNILFEFEKKFPKIQWIIERNYVSLGFRENFYKAISLAKGDYIFLCDQDDIWYENKIFEMVCVLNSKQNIKVLVTDFDLLICENARPNEEASRKISVYKPKNGHQEAKVKFEVSNFLNRRPGWTFAFKADLIPIINTLKENKVELYHDEIVWYAGLFSDGLYYIKKPMGKWRRFGSSVTINNISESKIQRFMRLLPKRLRRATEYLSLAKTVKVNKLNISKKNSEIIFLYFNIRYHFIYFLNVLLKLVQRKKY